MLLSDLLTNPSDGLADLRMAWATMVFVMLCMVTSATVLVRMKINALIQELYDGLPKNHTEDAAGTNNDSPKSDRIATTVRNNA